MYFSLPIHSDTGFCGVFELVVVVRFAVFSSLFIFICLYFVSMF